MDTTALSQLISALRAETQEESISPESLGALLQKIVDLLSNAGDPAPWMIYQHSSSTKNQRKE